MEKNQRYNFRLVKEMAKSLEINKHLKHKIDNSKEKNFVLEMFPYPSGKIPWIMLEIIQ